MIRKSSRPWPERFLRDQQDRLSIESPRHYYRPQHFEYTTLIGAQIHDSWEDLLELEEEEEDTDSNQ